ncbi:hypothetical protein U8C37_25500 (plasmid) [Sinorhizobium medicae]|nr:hypothetical protein [Sinorhizobium medicae]WQO88844.1 hypothetical protein U8C37_25500 [Sinorhizobium medicae]
MGSIFMAMWNQSRMWAGLRHRPRQALEEFGTIRDHGDVTRGLLAAHY